MATLNERIVRDLSSLARRCGLHRLLLFGSRARGDNRPRSDIDLAASGGDLERFRDGLETDVWTLLTFDVVDLEDDLSDDLRSAITRDGVLIYEQDSGAS